MVTRVFVEKRKGFDVEARHMMADLRQNLGLKAIEDLRILNRYDVSGLSGEEFEAAARTILSEPNVDNVYDENYKISSEYHVFATEFLPGQYDQRADSASQCVQLLTQGERPQVAYAKVIAVKGDLSEEEMDKIKNYIVNPVESRLASMEKPETLDMKIDVPADVKRVSIEPKIPLHTESTQTPISGVRVTMPAATIIALNTIEAQVKTRHGMLFIIISKQAKLPSTTVFFSILKPYRLKTCK